MISYRRLQPQQFEQWLDHCANVFAKKADEVDNFREYFKRHFINDPWRDMSTIFIAMDNDAIVGTVRLFKRNVFINKEVVLMGGIGEVSVKSNYQNKGIASNLLNLAIEEMIKSKCNVSFLFASRHHFYGRSGYQVIPLTYYNVEADKNVTSKYKLKKAAVASAEMIYPLYEKYSQNINCTISRNSYYWQNWVKDELKDVYLVINEADEIVAYINGYLENDNLIIKEYAEKDGYFIFKEISNLLASSIYQAAKTISYQGMFDTPVNFIETKEVNHLMVQLISPFSDDIITTNQLVDHLKTSRLGFFQTDNF